MREKQERPKKQQRGETKGKVPRKRGLWTIYLCGHVRRAEHKLLVEGQGASGARTKKGIAGKTLEKRKGCLET